MNNSLTTTHNPLDQHTPAVWVNANVFFKCYTLIDQAALGGRVLCTLDART